MEHLSLKDAIANAYEWTKLQLDGGEPAYPARINEDEMVGTTRPFTRDDMRAIDPRLEHVFEYLFKEEPLILVDDKLRHNLRYLTRQYITMPGHFFSWPDSSNEPVAIVMVRSMNFLNRTKQENPNVMLGVDRFVESDTYKGTPIVDRRYDTACVPVSWLDEHVPQWRLRLEVAQNLGLEDAAMYAYVFFPEQSALPEVKLGSTISP